MTTTKISAAQRRALSAEEQAQGFGQDGISKVERHEWRVVDVPGEFAMIHKDRLGIDHTYQREKINLNRVLEIAKVWSWAACGCLLVAIRPDGSLWVVDGQHRKLAADKRYDIQELPCMVFAMSDLPDESLAFIRKNANRGAMGALQKHKAEVVAHDDLALQIKSMVEKSGYMVARTATSADFHVTCVGLLRRSMQQDPVVARVAWKICVEIANGRFIRDSLYGAVFNLEKAIRKHEQSLLDKHNLQSLERHGVDLLLQRIAAAKGYYSTSSHHAGAQGLVELLNHRRKTRRLPDMPKLRWDGNGNGETDD